MWYQKCIHSIFNKKCHFLGNILEPLTRAGHEVRFYPRKSDMAKLSHLLRSEVSNQYYLIFGEVGTGKTRLITEVVRRMIANTGRKSEGAPIYIHASQGKSFPDTFANAVNYYFDEHMNFKFVLDFIFRVGHFPDRDDKSKLDRVLSAIEQAAFRYLEETGRPAVVIIDGVDSITHRMPDALRLLQEKAKMWADTNIVKMVFVSNDEKTEEVLQANHSAWSRAALPVLLGDLSKEEANEFLRYADPIMIKATQACRQQKQAQIRKDKARNPNGGTDEGDGLDIPEMPEKHSQEVINLVGGRVQNLLVAKREWLKGNPFEETANHLKLKERSKFIEISKDPSRRKVIALMYAAPGRRLQLSELIDKTSRDDVFVCAFHNVLRIERDDEAGLQATFESRLTENVVEEMYRRRPGTWSDGSQFTFLWVALGWLRSKIV